MAIRFVIDSGSDILPAEAEKKGMVHVPLTVSFEGQEYLDAVELGHEEFYDKLESCENLPVTSQVPPYRFEEVFEKVVSEGDTVIAITISGALSGTYQSACIAAAEFPGKVFVVDSANVSLGMRILVERGLELLKQGLAAEEIVEKLNEEKKRVRVLALLDTLEYLKKGGRITPAAAAIGTLLKLKPVLQIQGEKLDAFAKARTTNQGKTIMINAIKADIENRFGGDTEDKHIWMQIAHTNNEEAALAFKEEILEVFPGYDIHIDPLSLSVACHIGPGSLAFACCRKINV